MRCPKCEGPVRITTTVVVKHYPDSHWDVETPFTFRPTDPVACVSCDWSGLYQTLERT